MPLEIQADAVSNILRARYSGEVSLEERIQYANRIVEEAERTGIDRWLFDFREAHARPVDQPGARRMADELAPKLPEGVRMAYLLRYDHQLDDLVETQVRARGVSVERFHDPAEALAWLQAAPSPAPEPVGDRQAPETDVGRTLRLVAEIVGPDPHVSPEQLAALGDVVHDLLAAGLDEAKVRQVAGRMSAAMRPPSGA